MDFGIPDLSPGRDTAPDATRRRGKSEPSDFAALLDRTVDEPDDHARPKEPDEKRAAVNGADQQRERTARADHVDDNDQGERNDQSGDADQAAQAAAPTQQPLRDQHEDPQQNGSDTPQTTAQAGERETGAAASSEQDAEGIVPAAPAARAAPTPDAGAVVKPAKSVDATPVAADNVAPAVLPAQMATANEAVEPAAEVAVQPAPPDPSATPPASFAEQLAVAATKATDTTGTKANKSDASDAAPKPQMPDDVVLVAAVQPAAPAKDSNTQQNVAQGNPAQPASMPTVPHGAAPAAAPAVAQTPTGADAPSGTAEEPGSGDAALLAVLRVASAQPQASARTAESKPADATAPIDTMLKGVEIATKPAAEPAKTETASKPLGALAPGLGLAAQITSQQTPEQATAAERLAQLATAVGAQAEEIADTVDAQKPANIAAAPAKLEQPTQAAEVPTHRQAVTDVASTNEAARATRPNFHPVVTQVAAQVVQAAADGTDRINIRLSPAELGRIDVKLDFGPDGRVQAVFAAERPQTMELLQRDARDLERALQDAGLRADSGSLSFNLRGQGRDGQGEQTPNGSGQNHAPAEVAASQLQAYAAGSGAPGRLDIRI